MVKKLYCKEHVAGKVVYFPYLCNKCILKGYRNTG